MKTNDLFSHKMQMHMLGFGTHAADEASNDDEAPYETIGMPAAASGA
jgi:hypothetical protein